MQFSNIAALLVLAAGAKAWYQPTAGTTWDWQLQVPIVPTANVAVYDIDMFDNTAAVITDLHTRGRKVICYVDVGSWEDYRPDAASYPKSLLGATYSGFPNERWFDIRKITTTSPLGPLLLKRFQMAKDKGCDGIEPDNMDGYDDTAHESSGFPLTYNDQIVFNKWVASTVHGLGMAVGLKNDINQVTDLVPFFDFHVSEQAFQYDEWSYMVPFIQANKPVFEAEYSWTTSRFCPEAKRQKFSAIRKRNSLDSYRQACV